MDIQQLRSWIFELYEPLRNDRTYILLHGRDGVLIDVPAYSDRVARQIRGVCDPRLIFFSHAGRAAEVDKWRAAFPEIQLVAHEADAERIAGGVQHAVGDGEFLTRDPAARLVHLGALSAGHSVVLVGVPGGVLIVGDLLTTTADARLALPEGVDAAAARDGLEKLRALEFSALLTETGAPIWNAAKERYLELMHELPRRRTRFGHILDAPWDPDYIRVKPQMSHNPLVPENKTIAESAGHGPSTLVPAWENKPAREVAWAAGAPAPAAAAPAGDGKKKWSLAGETPATLPAASGARAQSLPWELMESPVAFRAIAAAELAAVPHVDWLYESFDLSRDGRDAVFAWDRSGTFEIYRAPVSGDEIFQLTSGGGRTRSVRPRISPDGRTVAFLRDTDTDERFDVFVVDRDGRVERKLTDRSATRGELAWSPDSRSLALVSDEEGGFALRVLDVASGTSRAIARELRFVEDLTISPAWSHDGRFISYHSGDAAANVDLYVVPADGSSAPRKLETRGGAKGQSRGPAWSPDDRALAFETDARGRWEIALLPLRDGNADGAARSLREGRFDETDPVWDVDARHLLYRRTADAQVSVRRAFLVSNDDEPALDAPGTHFAARVRPDGGLVYHWTSAREPADVWVKGVEDVLPRRVTRSLPSSLERGLFVEPRHVRYTSADGADVPALLYLPHREAVKGEGRPPAVVATHGGPTAQHFAWFDEWVQWFANRGYVVLAPNVRGSTGYGRAFREADRGDMGGRDADDVVAGAEWLAREGIADGDRIAAHGASYGGYLVLMALARAPKRFAAGCDVVGLTSLAPFFGATRADIAGAVRLYVEGLDEAEQRRRSPLELVDRIAAPLLVLHGTKDPRVPVAEAERLVEALRKRGKAFSYHAYDSGHLLAFREDRRDAFERAIEFFDEHVRDPRTAAARS